MTWPAPNEIFYRRSRKSIEKKNHLCKTPKLILYTGIWFSRPLLRCRALSAMPFSWICRRIVLSTRTWIDRKIVNIPPTCTRFFKNFTFFKISIRQFKHVSRHFHFHCCYLESRNMLHIAQANVDVFFRIRIGYAQRPRTDGRKEGHYVELHRN